MTAAWQQLQRLWREQLARWHYYWHGQSVDPATEIRKAWL